MKRGPRAEDDNVVAAGARALRIRRRQPIVHRHRRFDPVHALPQQNACGSRSTLGLSPDCFTCSIVKTGGGRGGDPPPSRTQLLEVDDAMANLDRSGFPWRSLASRQVGVSFRAEEAHLPMIL